MLPLPLLLPLKLLGGVLSKVPWYGWVIAVAVALAAWNRHQARSVRADFEQAKTAAAAERAASAAEARLHEQHREAEKKGAIDAARNQAARDRAALADQRTAARQLRDRLAALEARACGGDPGAGGGSQGAAEARDLSAYLRRRLDEAEEGTIEFADGTARARATCERQYRSLRPPE